MDFNQIRANLERLFSAGARVVFWRDEDGEFEEMLPSLQFDGVELRQVAEVPALLLKSELELNGGDVSFLLYEKGQIPSPDSDWLLDVRLYAEPFAADRSTILLRELGILEQAMRDHIAARGKFFASKERLARARKLIETDDDAAAIDRALMAVILRAEQRDIFTLVRVLFHTLDSENLDATPSAWSEISKYGLDQSFWIQARDTFGFDEVEPSLKSLLMRLLITDFAKSLGGPCPSALAHLTLSRDGASNAVVCVGQWRDSARFHESYDALSAAIADLVKLGHHLSDIDFEELIDARTFLLAEKYIASRLRDRIIETADAINLATIRDFASRRQNGYWANGKLPSSTDAPRLALDQVYTALVSAAEFFELQGNYPTGFSYNDAGAFFSAYTNELFRFDQLYRQFCGAADSAESEGWDILKTLREKIEDAYGNWYLDNLSMRWGEVLERGGLLEQWSIPDIRNQQDFFKQYVQPQLDKAEDHRVYVIISDAFRFEAAQELLQELNGRYRFSANLKPQLGVLPSYTSLGMASLLPHEKLSYSDAGDVMVDGMRTSGLANRKRILTQVRGTAIKADEFMAMSKTDGREFIKPHRVIYIYHNQIDQTADTGNEEKTFAAVRTTIDELAKLVSRVVNTLNGNFVFVTADHGFLFQETAPTESDKNPISDKPSGTVISKKRYVLGKSLPDHAGAFHGTAKTTADAEGDMEFWVPRGTNRFHFVGGSRFIHGGAMPQEIAVPVLQVAQLKGKSAIKTRTRTVGISVLGSRLKITTNRYRFKFIQNEAVSERIKPLKVKVAIYDGHEAVTNIEMLSFDSASSDMSEWRKEAWLTLASRTFDKKRRYQLIARNAETDVEELRTDVIIDRAFDDDF